jgi:hypothetical protein
MTGAILRILIIVLILGLIIWGARRIWRDWSGAFRAEDKARLARDRAERDAIRKAQGDMITLKRDKDGKFRPDE